MAVLSRTKHRDGHTSAYFFRFGGETRNRILMEICEACTRLEERERRLRSAYEGTIRALDKLGPELAPESYGAMRKMADHHWARLEEANQDLKVHKLNHLSAPADASC